MKVIKNENISCYVGDIVIYDDYPCMVVKDVIDEDALYPYLLVCLEGARAGEVLNAYRSLTTIDEYCSGLLIKKDRVVISSEEGDEVCPF